MWCRPLASHPRLWTLCLLAMRLLPIACNMRPAHDRSTERCRLVGSTLLQLDTAAHTALALMVSDVCDDSSLNRQTCINHRATAADCGLTTHTVCVRLPSTRSCSWLWLWLPTCCTCCSPILWCWLLLSLLFAHSSTPRTKAPSFSAKHMCTFVNITSLAHVHILHACWVRKRALRAAGLLYARAHAHAHMPHADHP